MHAVVQRIEQRRKEKGVMKSYLAKCCGKSQGWYSKMLKGNRLPTINDIEVMACTLDVDPGYFFDSKFGITEISNSENS